MLKTFIQTWLLIITYWTGWIPPTFPVTIRVMLHAGRRFFSDEVDGNVITEFCALRAKSYDFNVEGKDKIKAKGIRSHVVKNNMTLEDHRKCLFGEEGVELYREYVSIRSFNHQLMTLRTKKLTYNNYDDKREVLDDKINTLAHGHYSIE